jgi:hypothetical protein
MIIARKLYFMILTESSEEMLYTWRKLGKWREDEAGIRGDLVPLRGYYGEGTAGSFSPRIRRRRAVSLPPMAWTCSVAFARPKIGMLP